jgi:hydrogenase maturation protease
VRHALPAPDNAPLTVVGLGSPWGDDRVGWCVADALARRLRGTRARVVKLDRPGVGLLDEIAERPLVLLVDAADSGSAPGTLHSMTPEALLQAGGRAAGGASGAAPGTHGIGVAETLALGRSLGLLPAELRLYLVSIDSRRTGPSDAGLSSAVAAAVERLAAVIFRRLRACSAAGNGGAL